MKHFVFRNSTVEPFFAGAEYSFSGYDDISVVPADAQSFTWFYLVPFNPVETLLLAQISSFYNNLELVLRRIPADRVFYVFTLQDIVNQRVVSGNFSVVRAIDDYNQRIRELSERYSNVRIIDFSLFARQYSSEKLIDWKFYFLSKMQLNPRLAVDFKRWLDRQRQAISLKRKKCVIVDLDNTLWGGVLGEDGFNGIKIGGDYPGNAFASFQAALLELVRSGVILAVCSKNNESDVLEAWEKNPEILIKGEQIAISRINWNSKADNVREIVEELNIGMDSVVFIDDNPAERELIRKLLPSIEVPDFPEQAYMLPAFVNDLIEKHFGVYNLTDEDRGKTQQYKANAKRSEFQKAFTDFSEYLASLEIEIQLQKASEFTIPRIAQLTQKTNQFNLTTRRYTTADISRYVDSGHLVYCIGVRDKFGDHGITGLVIILVNGECKTAEIDSLLVSCRILGKGIEEAFVSTVLFKLKALGYETVFASFVETSKNEQVRTFYDRLGFVLVSEQQGEKKYSIDLRGFVQDIKPFYDIKEM